MDTMDKEKKIITVTTKRINEQLALGAEGFVEKCEKDLDGKVSEIAGKMIEIGSDRRPLILLAGPSGSGKTTIAAKLCYAIRGMGHPVCYLSMDSYFKTFTDEERALKAKNQIDLESPERLDAAFLNSELKKLIDGGKIDIPKYDFGTNSRLMTGKYISRNGGFVIVEGIHALNPAVLGDNDEFSTRIYASVRTRVVDSEGDKLHPSKIRLLRRMLRDKLFRSRAPADTIVMYDSVEQGEQKYIMPYKYRASINIDTFLQYEPALYRAYLPEIAGLAREHKNVRDVVKALDELTPLENVNIPANALIREFIGSDKQSD